MRVVPLAFSCVWRKRFEQYRIASGIGSQSKAERIITLLYCLGEESDDILTSTGVTDDERKSYKDVLDKFDSFFKVRKNVIFEQARFNRRQQAEGETAEQYIAVLYNLASNCNYGQMQDRMIWDRLIVGIRDTALSEQLQLDSELTLEKATKAIQQKEAVHEQQSVLNYGPTPSPLDAVRTGATNRKQFSHQTRQSNDQRHGQQQQGRKHCTRCGKSRTVEINAPHENQFVTDAIVKDTIAPSVSHKLFLHFQLRQDWTITQPI